MVPRELVALAHDVGRGPSSSQRNNAGSGPRPSKRKAEGACYVPSTLSPAECRRKRKKYLDQKKLVAAGCKIPFGSRCFPADPLINTHHMAGRRLQGFSVMQPNDATETAEARLANAVIAMDVSPPTATVRDVQLAIQKQFEGRALPLSITRFRSDFVIQFATPDERDLVTSSEILYGEGFDALLVRWSNRYGAQTVNWETEVAIDIDGFPPHTFHPSALGPLLERHCSIQAHNFSESRGICRVDAYALSKDSVPRSGEIGLQYPTPHGVTNMVFSITMVTYNYSEAPKFVQEEVHPNPADLYSADSIASFDTAEEFGYDREVLQEAYAWQHRANARLERRGYRGYASDSGSSSNNVSSDEPFYLPRDYSPARSFESDRSWHLY